MNTVAFVPLKLNNERLPGKNTRRLSNGEPLLSYILGTLSDVHGIDDTVVYCSDETVCEFLPPGVRFLKRSTQLDGAYTPINDVMRAFATDVDADIYVLAHATAPFISRDHIEQAVQAVRSGAHDSALTVQRLQEFLWQNGQPLNYDPAQVPRTQDLPVMHMETTGLYVYTRELVLKHGRRIGRRPRLIEVSKVEATDINEPIDFDIADALAARLGLRPAVRNETQPG